MKWKPEYCSICHTDPAIIFMILRTAGIVTKAHVCYTCFQLFHLCVGDAAENVSLQEFNEAIQTPCPQIDAINRQCKAKRRRTLDNRSGFP